MFILCVIRIVAEVIERMRFAQPRMQNQHLENRGVRHSATEEDGSATDLVSVVLLRGKEGVRLILANLPSVSYESAPRRFRETRSTILDC